MERTRDLHDLSKRDPQLMRFHPLSLSVWWVLRLQSILASASEKDSWYVSKGASMYRVPPNSVVWTL